MPSLRMQPAFTVDLPFGKAEAMRRIRTAIEAAEGYGSARVAGDCAEFAVRIEARRFWSPHLSVQISETDSGSQLYARFAPRPEIWTFFMLVYFMTIFFMFVGVLYAYVQWFMGRPPWGLLSIPVGAVGIGAIHIASLVGQGLSRDQMDQLREQLDRAVAAALGNAAGSDRASEASSSLES
ncbi:MAG: hypothetical protein ACF788_01980 [Novipirellula sp. JB048]